MTERATLNVRGQTYPGDHRMELAIEGGAIGDAFTLERKDAAEVGAALTRAIGATCTCGHDDCLLAAEFAAGAVAFAAVLIGKATVGPVVRQAQAEPAIGVGAVLDELAALRGDVLAAVASIQSTVVVNAAPEPRDVEIVRDGKGVVTRVRSA